MHLWKGLILFMFLVPAGWAASFDCKKASTRIEKMICDDPHLSKADEILAKAYFEAREKLSPPAQETLLKDQRDWLDSRDHTNLSATTTRNLCVGCGRHFL